MILGSGLAVLFAAALYWLRPEAAARWFGAALGFVVGDVLRIRRAHVVSAMDRAAVHQPRRQAGRMYRSLGCGVFELLGVAIRPERLLARVDLPALADPIQGGAVIATAHTGSWDLVACALARQRPLTVVTKRLSVRWLNWLWQRLRGNRGIRLVGEGAAAHEAMTALKDGELVAMLVDQVPERARGVTTGAFLDAPVAIDLAPALIAMRARVPLVVAFPFRDETGRHGVEIAAVFEPPQRVRRAWAETVMRQATERLEAFVRRRPEQWLWMHRRWRQPRRRSSAPSRLPHYGPGGIRTA